MFGCHRTRDQTWENFGSHYPQEYEDNPEIHQRLADRFHCGLHHGAGAPFCLTEQLQGIGERSGFCSGIHQHVFVIRHVRPKRIDELFAVVQMVYDFIINLLRPLSVWLYADHRQGASRRLDRFEQTVKQQADKVMRVSSRNESSVPLFLEAVSVLDNTEIWLEAIRLTAMGFNVAVDSRATGQPAIKTAIHQHHVMWCGAGISQVMQDYFEQQSEDGFPVMLSGPDRNLHFSQTSSSSAT